MLINANAKLQKRLKVLNREIFAIYAQRVIFLKIRENFGIRKAPEAFIHRTSGAFLLLYKNLHSRVFGVKNGLF